MRGRKQLRGGTDLYRPCGNGTSLIGFQMIVLSYAPDDMMRVERFYRAFHEAGLKPWMDSIDRPAWSALGTGLIGCYPPL